MSAAPSYRCRGLRKWCGRRCEAADASAPPAGYPVMGFYCGLHSHQKPKAAADGALVFDAPLLEEHVRRRTSFVAPEALVAAELAAAPGLVRDRPGAPSSATALGIVNWLVERRGLPEEAARAYAGRMVELEVLVPVGPGASKVFAAAQPNALYRVRPGGGGGGKQQ